MKVLLAVLGVLGVLVGLLWIGLKIRPGALPKITLPPGKLETTALPDGLPAPVERFYRTLYGDRVPVVNSVVLSGRGSMRPVVTGPTFPMRFRFTHEAGQNYRHYMEATFFGMPIMKGNEHFLDGRARLDLTIIGTSEGAKVDQAANLALWAEAIWFPSLFVTDPRLRWEPFDEYTAVLVVPYGKDEEHILVRFDPQTGLLKYVEAMRYRDESDDEKLLWIGEGLDWGLVDGNMLPRTGEITWFDQGSPWAVFTIEEAVFNLDVGEYIRQDGP